MPNKDFYTDFAYTDIRNVSNNDSRVWEEYEQFAQLGVDKVYFSGDYPAILFKDVADFSARTLKRIARIQHLAWNYRKVLFLFVVSRSEIRIYNCSKRPFNYEAEQVDIPNELQKLEVASTSFQDEEALESLRQVFSRVAVDSGTLWNSENAFRDKILLQERIDKYLVTSLLATAKALKRTELTDDIIHCLLMRSLFIMYLEDKGAAGETSLYQNILPGSSSYLHILEDKEATYALFRKVEEHFNGQVFPLVKGEEKQVTREHLALIRHCLYDGQITAGIPSLFKDWRLFRFDIVQIELLSEIYEHFLEEFKGHHKQQSGQYYTPPSLVELILNEKLPVRKETIWKFKVLDPACGSGIFLVESFKRLVRRWKNAHPDRSPQFADLRKILEENIFGIEIDRLAIRVTTFSLYLTLLEYLNPRTLWKDRRYKFPHLIYDPSDKTLQHQGGNLLRQDTISDALSSDIFGRIDLVVGNPPFGASISLPSVKKYCENHGFGQDMVIPFLHRSVEFASKGSIALIFNTKILTNTETPFLRFRQWLFEETYVEKIYNFSIFRKAPQSFGGQLFSSAVGPVSILFYQKMIPKEPSSKIEYWAPKSYVKSNLVDGIIIDSTDIKFLPREECANPATKIWKVAMWGSLEDFSLLKRLDRHKRLASILDEQDAIYAVGLRFLSNSTPNPIMDKEIPRLPYIRPDSIQRYYSDKENFIPLASAMSHQSADIYRRLQNLPAGRQLRSINLFRRIGKDKRVYYGPHVLIKSGLSDKQVCASYIEADCTFDDKVLGLKMDSVEWMKAVTAVINSKLATYYLFLISASIGIEREEIKTHEVYDLPMLEDPDLIRELSELMDEIIQIKEASPIFKPDISALENKIDQCIYRGFQLTQNDQVLIEDFYELTTGLLFEGHKSTSLRTVSSAENQSYARLISAQINKFLSSNKLMVNAAAFDIQRGFPLNMIRLSFDSTKKDVELFDANRYKMDLEALNQYTLQQYAKNIYIQKEIKYFDGNIVYIVKPNQKRFWSRSMAVNDANNLIYEILKMS